MADSIDISVIIPGYNCSSTLARCLDSVLAQQPSGNYEIIYIDDCSTDDSLLVAQLYLKSHRDIDFTILSANSHTGSPSNGRNLGISNAKGEYIYFLDADDTIAPSGLHELLHASQQCSSDYTCSLHLQQRESFNVPPRSSLNVCGITDLSLNKVYNISLKWMISYYANYFKFTRTFCLFEHCWGRLYKKSLIDEANIYFSLHMDQLEDVLFNARYLLTCSKFTLITAPLYIHHLSSNVQRLSFRSGEKESLLSDLYTVATSLYTLYESFFIKSGMPSPNSNVIEQFLSSKVSNYLVRLLIQISTLQSNLHSKLLLSFHSFHTFYIDNLLYNSAYIADDESKIIRFLLRYRLHPFFYVCAWRFVQLLRRYKLLVKVT